MNALANFAKTQPWTAMVFAVFVLFLGAGLAAKMDSRWGYVIMLIAIVFGVFVLRTHGIVRF